MRTIKEPEIRKGEILDELKNVMWKKKAFIVTDTFLYKNGYALPVTDKLDEMGIAHTTFFTTCRFVLLATGYAGNPKELASPKKHLLYLHIVITF